MIKPKRNPVIFRRNQLGRLLSLGIIVGLVFSAPGWAQAPATPSVAPQPEKQMAEVKSFLDRLTEIKISPQGRYRARWQQPIKFYVSLPQDQELQKQLTAQLYRLNNEVPGLPVLTVKSKLGTGTPDQANFVIESAPEQDIQQKAAAHGISIGTDACALSINIQTRGALSAQINRVHLMVRENPLREASLRCLLKLVMVGLGIGDPDKNSVFLLNATFNAFNRTENGFGAGDVALLRYAYAEKTSRSPKGIPPDEKLALSFLEAQHMAQRALPIQQEVKSLIERLYTAADSREQSFTKLVALLGKPSALAYLALLPMEKDKDYQIFQQVIAGVDQTDFDLLYQQCAGCFFSLLANSVEGVIAQGRQSDTRKLISTMVAADKPANSPVQRFITLYYQSILDWESPTAEKKLKEALHLVKIYHGVHSPTFLNFQGALIGWYVQHDNLKKAIAQMEDSTALYNKAVLPPLNEGRHLMSRAEIYQKAGNKLKARQNLAEARRIIENSGTDQDLVRLETIEKNLAAN